MLNECSRLLSTASLKEVEWGESKSESEREGETCGETEDRRKKTAADLQIAGSMWISGLLQRGEGLGCEGLGYRPGGTSKWWGSVVLLKGYHQHGLARQIWHSTDGHYSLVTHPWKLGDACTVQISGAQTHGHHIVTQIVRIFPLHRDKKLMCLVFGETHQ